MSVFKAKLERFRGRRVLVVGLGRSGVAAARVLAPVAARVTACDRKMLDELGAEAAALSGLGVDVRAGGQDAALLADADLVVRSPGVPWELPLLAAARDAGVELIGELELAYRLLATDRLVAVTGSNGKSTTTALLGEIFRQAGEKVTVAGNIGVALAAVVAELEPGSVVVVEVSSFQLEDTVEFKPRVGVLLNLAPDHLDRHGIADRYYRLKWRLFENQDPGDVAVLNADDADVAAGAEGLEAEVAFFGRRDPGGPGAWVDGGTVYYRMGGNAGALLPAAEVRIPGPHNLANAMAASCAALALGAGPDAAAAALRSFAGLPHRLQPVGEVAGVRYVNDSKATNVASALVALASFDAPVVLIAGGKAKGEEFTPLAAAARGRVRAAILYGAARQELARALEGAARLEFADTVPAAVSLAARLAEAGDVVLLAPACTSWDQYRNFEERGEDFRRAVAALGAEVENCGRR